jgi:tetratricopeptide (TPR) repeat protein
MPLLDFARHCRAAQLALSTSATVVLGSLAGWGVPGIANALVADTAAELSQAGPFRRSPSGSSGFRQGQPITELTAEAFYEFLLAEIALQRGQLGVATQAYVDLARRTRDARVARRATEVGIHARMPNAAVDAARLWQEIEPNSDEALRTLATLLVSTGRLDEAEPHLRNVLARQQSDLGEGFLQLTQFLGSNADKPGVLRLMLRLAEPHAQVPGARLAVAQAAAGAGEDALALSEARAAAQLRPGWEQAALVEASVLQKQSPNAAADQLRQFLTSHPNAREVRLAYARLLVAERDYDGARKEFQALTEANPNNADVLYAIGLLSMQLEDWALAEKHLQRLLTLEFRDRDLIRLYLGQVAEEQKRYPEALARYREVKSGEHALTAQIRQSNVLAKQGNLDQARGMLQQASAANNQQRVQLVLAETQLLRDANKTGEALDVIERALDKLPNHPDLLYDHAMLAEKLDKVDVMEASLRKVIAIKPDHAHAYNALGYSLADRNLRLAEARELIEKAVKLAPDDFFILDSLGWVLYRQGDLEGAAKHLARAYKGRPDAEIGAHLGEVLWQLGRRDEALRIWQEAAKKSPENETLQKTMKRFQEATAVK